MKRVSGFVLVLMATTALSWAVPVARSFAADEELAAVDVAEVKAVPPKNVTTKTSAAKTKAASKAADEAAEKLQEMQDPKNPVSKPMSAWLVGPSQASHFDEADKPDGIGCLMVTEFDNGMIVGIHARKTGIVGMTVDMKKATLVEGQEKSVGINIGADAYVMTGYASDESTLSFNLEEAGGGRSVTERLTKLGNFRLLLDDVPYYFATTGFTDGLARMQACMGGTMAVTLPVTGPGVTVGKIKHNDAELETMRVTSSGTETPLALAMPNLIPMGYNFEMENIDPMTPISWQAGDDWVTVLRTALQPHNLKISVKGETVRILRRTSEQDPVVETDQNKDEAVAVDTASDDAVRDVAEVRAMAPIPEGGAAASGQMPDGVWGGAEGEKLSDVIEAWGLMAGVNVKVDLQGDLRLPADIRYEGRFDEAVQKLLGQFGGRNKPVGKFRGMGAVSTASSSKSILKAPEPKSDWKPRAPSELREMAKEAQAKWAPVRQMSTIADPPEAPKTAKETDKVKAAESTAKKAKAEKTAKAAKADGKSEGTWQALQGTSLRDALEHWGRDAGVKVVWLADQSFPLPESIRSEGKFEEAVTKALAQYAEAGAQPSAQLNKDPDTGETALIIRTKGL